MARDGITRRDLLRGRASPASPAPPAYEGPVVKPGGRLPDLISWLDPEMRPTPRRGAADEAFPLLRPPGAVAEPDFLAACTRCGDCASACAPRAIREAPARLRAAAGTPIIDPITAACQLCEDLPCIAACETGALRPEAPAVLGRAWIQPTDCLNRPGSSCSVCLERCPVPGALVARQPGGGGGQCGVPEVDASLCTGCGVCQHVCPAPDNAVVLLPNPDRPTTAALDLAAARERDARGPDDLELPELREGLLDEDGLRALFRDLASAASDVELRMKDGAGRRGHPTELSPDEALSLLLDGAVRGVQVRYRYAGQDWCDTILPAPEGHRVVRMASPTRPAGLA